MDKYCKVCKWYRADLNGCTKHEKFCDLEDFEPSWFDTVLNALYVLWDKEMVEEECLDLIENKIYELKRRR